MEISNEDNSASPLTHSSNNLPKTNFFSLVSEHDNTEVAPEVNGATHHSAQDTHILFKQLGLCEVQHFQEDAHILLQKRNALASGRRTSDFFKLCVPALRHLTTNCRTNIRLLLEIVDFIVKSIRVVQKTHPKVNWRPRKSFYYRGLHLIPKQHQFSIVNKSISPFHHISKFTTVLKPRDVRLSLRAVII